MDLKQQLIQIATSAKTASSTLATLSETDKNTLLDCFSRGIDKARQAILNANAMDCSHGQSQGLSAARIDRLTLTDARLDDIIEGIHVIKASADPIGAVLSEYQPSNGLNIKKIRVPIGVIAIIYESRPNVTADVAALCLKSGNAVILRGGRDALHSNQALYTAMHSEAQNAGLPEGAIQLITFTSRHVVTELVQLTGLIDCAIPRGGQPLIEAVVQAARIPVIKHYKGLCHTYIDQSADCAMALAIAENAKCQRPGVCNAMETLLVHQAISPQFLPSMVARFHARGIACRGCPRTLALLADNNLSPATEADWDTEYLDKIIAIKIVDSVDEAIQHINQHGTGHSEAIITSDSACAERFTARVDAASVYVNASTRFTDGAAFGLGAEMGISTDKLHARGPMGLLELTSYKYVIHGSGQIRE